MLKTLQSKMVFIFTLLIIGALIISQIFTYSVLRKQVYNESLSKSGTIVKEANKQISQSIQKYSHDMSYLSQSGMFQLMENKKEADNSDKTIQNSLREYKKNNVQIESISLLTVEDKVITPEGIFLNSKSEYKADDWYKEALLDSEKTKWTVFKNKDQESLIAAKGVKASNGYSTLGVLVVEIDVTMLKIILSSLNLDYAGFPFMIDADGIALSLPKMEGKNVKDESLFSDIFHSKKKNGNKLGVYNNIDYVVNYETIPVLNWKIGVAYEKNDIMKTVKNIGFIQVLIGMVSILVAIILVYVYARRLSKPIKKLSEEVEKVALGDLTVYVDGKSHDEIGSLTMNFNEMVMQMRIILHRVSSTISQVNESVEHLTVVSDGAIRSSQEVATAIDSVAKGASDQSEQLDEMNTRTEEMSTSIDQISKLISSVHHLVGEADVASQNGANQLKELIETTLLANKEMNDVEVVVNDLVNRLQSIEQVMKIITDISSQTNLLSLNASIEAARAGEHGRGFAVVANEVRKLADQTKIATEQVHHTITGIQQEAEKASLAMKRTIEMNVVQEKAVRDTEDVFIIITTLSEGMSQSVEEVKSEVQKVNIQKNQFSDMVQHIAAASQEAAASSEEVSAATTEQVESLQEIGLSAERLANESKELEMTVEGFKLVEEGEVIGEIIKEDIKAIKIVHAINHKIEYVKNAIMNKVRKNK